MIYAVSMSFALSKPMTLAEFLAWEERQAARHEFDGVRPVAMTGGTRAHATIEVNFAIVIGGRLRGGPCRFYGSDLKIRTGDDRIRDSDGFVACAAGESASTVVSDPVIIFEVLSPTTAALDRIVKAREYQATPSVQRYVMLEQDRIGATVYARIGEGWTHEILIADSTLDLPEIGIALPLAELYEGLVFAPEERTLIARPAVSSA
jgi:Uma2 family endonuclease